MAPVSVPDEAAGSPVFKAWSGADDVAAGGDELEIDEGGWVAADIEDEDWAISEAEEEEGEGLSSCWRMQVSML